MLVVSRKLEEQIHIGDDIIITVVRLTGGSVRLGIDAPRAVGIVRGEIKGRPTGQSTGDRGGPSSLMNGPVFPDPV